MLKWLKWKIAREEMAELERWRVYWHQHRQWLAEFPDVSAALDNLREEALAREPVNISEIRDGMRSGSFQSGSPVDTKRQVMADPKLVAVKTHIQYESDDGHLSGEVFGSMQQGVDDPIRVLSATVREVSRLLALFGYSERAQESTNDAIKSVAAWRAQRADKAHANF